MSINQRNHTNTTVTLPNEVKLALRKAAADQDKSISALLSELALDYVTQHYPEFTPRG